MNESLLPRMHTRAQNIVLGGLKKSVNQDRKITIVLGEPGEGKTTTILDFCAQNEVPSYYYRCSPNTTMNSLLTFMANAIGAHISGRNDEIQEQIQAKLKEDNNYCFVFDEIENLVSASGAKIDVIRQIYDSTNVEMVICGTYDFKDMICGEKKKSSRLTHNRPQIFRRLRKEEFDRITEREIYDYLSLLETSYAVTFADDAKAALVSLCRDRRNGGLGNFIEVIELIFSYVRPEWTDISWQIIEDTGRILHTNTEAAQSFTAIKPRKKKTTDSEELEVKSETTNSALTSSIPVHSRINLSSLPNVLINLQLLEDALHHKASM